MQISKGVISGVWVDRHSRLLCLAALQQLSKTNQQLRREPETAVRLLGGQNNYHTILVVPYYNCRIMGPKTPFELLRPLYYLKPKA